jgi:hypothetical protein
VNSLELKLKINPTERLAYIPKAIFNILGPDVCAAPNRSAVLMFSSDTGIDDVLKSLDIIKADLRHARQLQKNKESVSILKTSQEAKAAE